MVLLRFVRGKCSEDNQGVTLKVALRDLFGDPIGGKEGKRGIKTGSMSRGKSSLVLEKGRFKHTKHYQAPQGMRVLTGGTRNSNVYVDW